MTEKWVKSKGNGTSFELAGEFELRGFYCIYIFTTLGITNEVYDRGSKGWEPGSEGWDLESQP